MVGDHDCRMVDEGEMKVKVTDIIAHPWYTACHCRKLYDVAILVLSKKIQYSSRILPACLPSGRGDQLFDMVNGIASGWGEQHNDDSGNATSDPKLMSMATSVLPSNICQKAIEENIDPRGQDPNDPLLEFCIGTINASTQSQPKGIWYGDMGGNGHQAIVNSML